MKKLSKKKPRNSKTMRKRRTERTDWEGLLVQDGWVGACRLIPSHFSSPKKTFTVKIYIQYSASETKKGQYKYCLDIIEIDFLEAMKLIQLCWHLRSRSSSWLIFKQLANSLFYKSFHSDAAFTIFPETFFLYFLIVTVFSHPQRSQTPKKYLEMSTT